MPFVARLKTTGERVDITQYPSPRDVFRKGDCVCQMCGAELGIRAEYSRLGYKVSAHFYHFRECQSEYGAHPESYEHLMAKVLLREKLLEFYRQYGNPQIDLEVPIPMAWRARGRIVDLLVTWTMGWREAHEIQLASITPQELEERTNDYARAGIDVIWWLGGRAATSANRDWCIGAFGESHRIHVF